MNVFIRMKAVGKRRDIIEMVQFIIPENVLNVKDLIKHIVTENVKAFNNKDVDSPFFQYLTEKEIDEKAYLGKIGFNDKKNENKQDIDKAVENAIQCFEDGIFKVLVNDTEVFDDVNIKEKDVLTFIRLTMLAGRLW